jgi:uncharacterized membrane protein
MLILAYFAEGTVRVYTDQGMSGLLALAEVLLTSVFFIAAIAHVRAGRPVRSATPAGSA